MENIVISGRKIVERMREFKELKEFSQVLGIPIQTISNWKVRDSAPKSDDVYKIACFLNVSVDWLLTGKEKENFSPQDINFLHKLHSLKDSNYNAVVTLLNSLYKQEENSIEKKNQIG